MIGPTEAGAIEIDRKPRPISAKASMRPAGHLAAKRNRNLVLVGLDHNMAQHAQRRWAKHIETAAHPVVAAVRRKNELQQIVAADRNEINAAKQFVELPQDRRHFDHRAKRDLRRAGAMMPAQMRRDLSRSACGPSTNSYTSRQEWQHQPQLAPSGCMQ